MLVDGAVARRHSATTDCVSGVVSVSTGMTALTTGQRLDVTCMSHPRTTSHTAGVSLSAVGSLSVNITHLIILSHRTSHQLVSLFI